MEKRRGATQDLERGSFDIDLEDVRERETLSEPVERDSQNYLLFRRTSSLRCSVARKKVGGTRAGCNAEGSKIN